MTLTVVKEVPRKAKKNLRGMLDEFMRMNVKAVRVDFNEKEYAHIHSCDSSFHKAVSAGAYPIDVRMFENCVYLERRDMD